MIASNVRANGPPQNNRLTSEQQARLRKQPAESAEFSVYHADVDNSWEGEVVNHLLNLLFFSHPISILIRFMIAVNAFQVRF